MYWRVLFRYKRWIGLLIESTIDSEGFKGGTRGAPIMPRDAVSRIANVGMVGKNGLKNLVLTLFIA